MILYCSYCEESRRHVKNEQRTHARSKHNLNGNQEDFKTKQTRSHILSVFFFSPDKPLEKKVTAGVVSTAEFYILEGGHA